MAVNQLFYNGKEMFNLINDTVDAAHLRKGYTAHDRYGEQITGISSLDSDTRDATATPKDIAYGKTAYVNEEKITGSLQTISDLRRIELGPTEQLTISGPILHKEGIVVSYRSEILNVDRQTDESGGIHVIISLKGSDQNG